MKSKEWTYLDRSKWGRGEWDAEPDSAQWPDADTGLPCLAHRNSWGAWCGYVGVSEGHPAFGVKYDSVEVPDREYGPEVHGGLTYSDHCWGKPGTGICHLPDEGEPDHVWWLGFDCGHSGDYRPQDAFKKQDNWRLATGADYRTLDYVRAECANLAAQLAKAR